MRSGRLPAQTAASIAHFLSYKPKAMFPANIISFQGVPSERHCPLGNALPRFLHAILTSLLNYLPLRLLHKQKYVRISTETLMSEMMRMLLDGISFHYISAHSLKEL